MIKIPRKYKDYLGVKHKNLYNSIDFQYHIDTRIGTYSMMDDQATLSLKSLLKE
jgi:hypothetical protein